MACLSTTLADGVLPFLSVSLHWWLPLSVTLASPLFSLHLMMVIAVRADLSSLSHGLQHLGWVPLCMLHDCFMKRFCSSMLGVQLLCSLDLVHEDQPLVRLVCFIGVFVKDEVGGCPRVQ